MADDDDTFDNFAAVACYFCLVFNVTLVVPTSRLRSNFLLKPDNRLASIIPSPMIFRSLAILLLSHLARCNRTDLLLNFSAMQLTHYANLSTCPICAVPLALRRACGVLRRLAAKRNMRPSPQRNASDINEPLKPGPQQQQFRSNIVECYKSNDSFQEVEC